MTSRRRPIVETFNTHRMRPEVIRALATGRDRECDEIMAVIRAALDHPGSNPQHLVVYGERGSGKSFLMRMVELATAELAAAGQPVAMVLLPEEQRNIRSEAQLLEALSAALTDRAFVYQFDDRAPAVAWQQAVAALEQALDARFGPGRGLLVAGIENFDILSQKLFGAGQGKQTRLAVEQQAAEERLRALMGRPGGRLLLLATATGTVDMDYERPLFQVFQAVDLSPWCGDTCIGYFNRRRRLEQTAALNPRETARARAISAFIGGNPRLAQLLGEVLTSPEARDIADTLDALSDQLADYYNRRLDDLPPVAAGLLDALIRLGEPCSQTELAERVNQTQNRIADAFSHLTASRILTAEREIGGPRQLYRVRDRLFVHFYRRRLGGAGGADDLARIAELLASFYTADEKAEQALRHLDAGEPDAARLYLGLRRTEVGDDGGWCGYRDQDQEAAAEPCLPLAVLDLSDAELATIRAELADCEHPDAAYRRWHEAHAALPAADPASDPLRAAALSALYALAASRCGGDDRAGPILTGALAAAEAADDADARVLVLDQLSGFVGYRRRDRKGQIDLARRAGGLAQQTRQERLRVVALPYQAFADDYDQRFEPMRDHAQAAVRLAEQIGATAWQSAAERGLGFALGRLGEHQAAITALDRSIRLAEQAGVRRGRAQALREKAWNLGALRRHGDALPVLDQALALATGVGDLFGQAAALRGKGFSLSALDRRAEAVPWLDQAIALAERCGDVGGQAQALRHRAWAHHGLGHGDQALADARAALALAPRHGDADVQQRAWRGYLQFAAETAAPDLPERLAEAMALEPEGGPGWPDGRWGDLLAATTRADAWPAVAALLRNQRVRLATIYPWDAFDRIGPVWAGRAEADGRAAAYALAAAQLPAIAEVMTLLPHAWERSIPPGDRAPASEPLPSRRRRRHLRDLIDGLTRSCANSGLLRDLADLIPTLAGRDAIADGPPADPYTHGATAMTTAAPDRRDAAPDPEIAAAVALLRRFADYHEAPNKAAFLQRCDPDLAIAIRRIWQPDAPEANPGPRARPRAR